MTTAAKELCPKCGMPVGPYDKKCENCGQPLGGAALPANSQDQTNNPPMRVSIVDLDMPIGSMMGLLIKLAIAFIPVAIIVGAVVIFVMGVLGLGVGLMTRP